MTSEPGDFIYDLAGLEALPLGAVVRDACGDIGTVEAGVRMAHSGGRHRPLSYLDMPVEVISRPTGNTAQTDLVEDEMPTVGDVITKRWGLDLLQPGTLLVDRESHVVEVQAGRRVRIELWPGTARDVGYGWVSLPVKVLRMPDDGGIGGGTP